VSRVDVGLEVAAEMVRLGLGSQRRLIHGRGVGHRFPGVNAAGARIAVVARAGGHRRGARDASDFDRGRAGDVLGVVEQDIAGRDQHDGRGNLCANDGTAVAMAGRPTNVHGRTDFHVRLVAPRSEGARDRHSGGGRRACLSAMHALSGENVQQYLPSGTRDHGIFDRGS